MCLRFDVVFKCVKYFQVFSDKNIDTLSEMFSDDVELRDWNIFASGKKNVVDV